jgi:cellulose synthase/poly-beta-1,6-N-acetylglucosamine synthase-like glycosyltransferase/peptidoglycan/xylan/chitin deacetylase (PgdA/CDA1 family)/spore germination protein YaaH
MTNLQLPVFYAPNGKRWKRARFFAVFISVIIAILIGVFFFSLYVTPFMPSFSIRAKPILSQNNGPSLPAATDPNTTSGQFQPKLTENGNRPLTIGFYVNYDDTSYASLKRNIDKIDWLSPEWVRLQDGDNPLVLDFDEKALDLIRKEKPNMPILPLVQNYKDEVWSPQILARQVATKDARQKLIDALTKMVEDNKFAGLTIDLEEVPLKSQANLFEFMKALYAAFHVRGWMVAQAVPFDNPDWNYKAYADFSDYLMLMAYDEHWATGGPGAISSQSWFETLLAKRMKELNPAKTIVCIGNYGYDWSNKEKEAAEVSFQESVLSARDSEAKINFDLNTQNPYFSYDEDDGSHHTVWFLDAVTAFNQIRASEKFKPFGFALWRLGSEDPSLWDVFGSENTAKPNVENLKDIRYGYDIDFEGIGEILQVIAEPQDGSRTFNFNESGAITTENYTATPSSYVIQRTGDHPGLVALTFDDGPDPDWTPRILDELKKEDVPATFFVVGSYGQENPGLIRRIVSEGHDIGNHSFTHPNLGEIPNNVTTVEINATQRLIQSLTGRSTTLFRAPYFGDAEPTTADEVEPIVEARQLGYITIGLHIDPDDWQTPGTDEIVKRTVDGITNKTTDEDVRGQIVLLHDGGGDRSQTLAALPRIIETLRAKGYKFVTVSQLAGLSQEKTMPFVAENERIITQADSMAFSMFWFFDKTMKWLFWLGIVLGTARLLFISILALRTRFIKQKTVLNDAYQPFVSVIVPAFNEEKVVLKTLKSLLKSNYPNFEILVIDDGSSDNTSQIIKEKFADEPKVQLFTLANSGKANALNYGLKRAKGEIIIGLDADTVFMPATICELAKKFADPAVGAVAGNAKVGNRLNIITKWQALEYITSQNLDRRAFAGLNAITVVPGAVGAWRREALERAEGFESNTLAEDQDLTLRVRQLGYRIAYAEHAIAYTEAPDTFKGLAKQRFRWSFGTLQCMWKHRRALFNRKFGALGFVAMPNVWIFQILFPLVAPLMDLMFVWTMLNYLIQRLEHPKEFSAPHVAELVYYYAFFLVVDLLAASVGFTFERRENWKLLAWLPVQRFGYRQVMYSVMIKSVKNAFKGVLVGWNKVERKATVTDTV